MKIIRLITCLLILCFAAIAAVAGEIKNIIFLIGDGMGPGQIEAGRDYSGAPLSFESFPYQSTVTTYCADNPITDSAAAGTALATGNKVNYGVVSLALPGDGHELTTLLELSQADGKMAGLVTTRPIPDATPAVFAAHEADRWSWDAIANDYLTQSRPNVLYGAGGNTMTPSMATSAGYTVVVSLAELQALNTETATLVSGQFGADTMPFETQGMGSLPHLSQMATNAISILDNDPDGFFVMIEGGQIDSAAHVNNLQECIGEVIEFSHTVAEVMNWATNRTDTLVIVTADHETGGLTVTADNGAGNYPTVTWSTTYHTSTPVPVYAWGPHAETFTNATDNTDIFRLISNAVWAVSVQTGVVENAGIAGMRLGGSNGVALVMSWNTATGRFYSVWTSTNLMDAWTNVAESEYTNAAGIGAAMSYTNLQEDPARFFRVKARTP